MDSNKYKPVNKKTQHLRFMMSYLDNAIGDCSEEVKECIDLVWDAIEELEQQQ
jgi:hypothetical protein|tara:strand:+ start:246 stop:404 length:159 start_codon:yes stop_codon:yes gene_type:complete